jgi:hypothetical protein
MYGVRIFSPFTQELNYYESVNVKEDHIAKKINRNNLWLELESDQNSPFTSFLNLLLDVI